MPTYQYQCRNCGHELEEFQSITEPPSTHCPQCNTESLVRVLGGGAGLIFKGSGFYLTDYKKTSTPPAAGTKSDTAAKPAAKGSAPAAESAPAKSEPGKKEGS
ncbi:MAG: Zinc ribbon domain protein [Bacteroidetes bacterium]|nr:Zinc ribbon domain protein [Bacteroidota bacterium]